MKISRIFLHLFITLLVYSLFYSQIGVFSTPFSYAFSLLCIYWLEIFIFLPSSKLKEITEERLNFNIELSGLKNNGYKKKLKFKIFIFILALVTLSFIQFKNSAYLFIQEAIEYLTPVQALAIVQYPAFEKKEASLYPLSNRSQNIELNSSSVLNIKLNHAHNQNNWDVILQDSLNKNNQEISSLDTTNYSAEFFAGTLFKKYETHPIILILTNGKNKFLATVYVTPTPRPIVKLKEEQVHIQAHDLNHQKLAFSLDVNSQIDLTEITFLIKTDSGFEYEQVVTEFPNANEKSFVLPYTEVFTTGIPFRENDVLTIKAIAKTPLIDVQGESKEFKYKITKKNPMEKEGNKSSKEDKKNAQSDKEALTTQNSLDESWRKNILENIIRLKKENKEQNKPLIQYLESRLR